MEREAPESIGIFGDVGDLVGAHLQHLDQWMIDELRTNSAVSCDLLCLQQVLSNRIAKAIAYKPWKPILGRILIADDEAVLSVAKTSRLPSRTWNEPSILTDVLPCRTKALTSNLGCTSVRR